MTKLFGLTGPSSFSDSLMGMTEEYFGANYVLLYHDRRENLNYWLDKVDAIIFAGGADIHPAVYGQSVLNNANMTKFDLRRDNRELQVLEYARSKNKPVLGICRGHQLIGVANGLTLIPDISGSDISHQPSKAGVSLNSEEPIHVVNLIDKDKFYDDYPEAVTPVEWQVVSSVMQTDGDKPERLWVNSFHHQALLYEKKKDIPGLRVLGTSRVDARSSSDVVKNIELMDGPGWISCQWHPEYDWQSNTASRAVLARFKKMIG